MLLLRPPPNLTLRFRDQNYAHECPDYQKNERHFHQTLQIDLQPLVIVRHGQDDDDEHEVGGLDEQLLERGQQAVVDSEGDGLGRIVVAHGFDSAAEHEEFDEDERDGDYEAGENNQVFRVRLHILELLLLYHVEIINLLLFWAHLTNFM